MNDAMHARHPEDDDARLEGLQVTVLEAQVRLCEATLRAAFLAAALERIAALPPSGLDEAPRLARSALSLSLGR